MNVLGRNFKVSLWGESHGPAIGCVVDGVPSGIILKESDFDADIARRKSGAPGTTARNENDKPKILSGVLDGYTTGAPISIMFENADVQSDSYKAYKDTPRPGHADFTAGLRYEMYNDFRGGGHLSGRLTLPMVAAGVIAKKVLEAFKCSVKAEIVELGGLKDKKKWDAALKQTQAEGDSLGAVVQCEATLPAGLGEPIWDSVESLIAHAVFAIPGVRGVEFGDGFRAAAMKGSEHNDPFGPNGLPAKNGSGGVNGGLTNGAPLLFRVAFKPTSSISKPQNTFNFTEEKMTRLVCGGRHDCCFALRTPPVVEAVTAMVIADLL